MAVSTRTRSPVRAMPSRPASPGWIQTGLVCASSSSHLALADRVWVRVLHCPPILAIPSKHKARNARMAGYTSGMHFLQPSFELFQRNAVLLVEGTANGKPESHALHPHHPRRQARSLQVFTLRKTV